MIFHKITAMKRSFIFGLLLFLFFLKKAAAQPALHLGSGAALHLGSATLRLHETDLTNEGYINAGAGKIIFSGSQDAQLTSSGTYWYDLQLELDAGRKLLLQDAAALTHQLHFAADNLVVLGPHDFTLTTDATLTGTSGQRYFMTNGTGFLQKENLGAAGFTFPLGFDETTYNPATLAQNGAPGKYGLRCLTHHFEEGPVGDNFTTETVDASWEISEPISGGSDLDLTVQWAASDELSFNRNDCAIGQWDGAKWDYGSVPGSAAAGTGPFTQSRSGIAGGGIFGVRSGAVLPLELLHFDAAAVGEDAQLRWETASEQGVSHFEIERRSAGNFFWEKTGTLAAKGNSFVLQKYITTDRGVGQQGGQFYYRLKLVDLNGDFAYSPVRQVLFEKAGGFAVYPNPASEGVAVFFSNEEHATASVQLFSLDGKLVAAQEAISHGGRFVFGRRLASGAYILLLKTNEGKVLQQRLVLEQE